jgi:hypothetical protein
MRIGITRRASSIRPIGLFFQVASRSTDPNALGGGKCSGNCHQKHDRSKHAKKPKPFNSHYLHSPWKMQLTPSFFKVLHFTCP